MYYTNNIIIRRKEFSHDKGSLNYPETRLAFRSLDKIFLRTSKSRGICPATTCNASVEVDLYAPVITRSGLLWRLPRSLTALLVSTPASPISNA